MSRTEEREEFKRFASGFAIGKPKSEEEEEFKFLNDLASCTYMNRKGLDPLCDYFDWSQKIPEPIDIHIFPPSALLPPKPVPLRGHGLVRIKPGQGFEDLVPFHIPAKLPDEKALEHQRPKSLSKYWILKRGSTEEKVRAEYEKLRAEYTRAGYEKLRAEYAKASYRPYLPPEMNSLLESIQKSRSLLELEDDWDGEGSVGYTEATWLRARNFLMRNAVRLYQSHKQFFDPPKFEPGPNGSIDLHWKTDARELLINVPADPHDTISFYGDDRVEDTENAIRGKNIESSTNTEWIFLWLTQ